MGRKKLAMRRIENATTRQVTYAKRKDGIVKKASELAVLCDTDVAVVMFSPTGRLTTFASNGRVEDIFLRFVDRPDELRGGPIANEEFLSERLKQLKYEGEMLEKIATYYEPSVEKINTVLEAGVYQQFLTSAIQRVQLSKLQAAIVPMDDTTTSVAHHTVNQSRMSPGKDDDEGGTMGPHLSLSFLEAKKRWEKIRNVTVNPTS
ncbi:AGAMOUS-like 66 isoform 1 [Dorcoceras hygrometricum]|uniref:AGAMOUS-like 66 isoform 1 n=1 Tax=Dorcoceras hygrometricum TaxID=472368 RepID=A0A2Z7A856_9LAMI|nr:AGAMOUS-like 66 isoform 1 [Dorcoceras hygrometricum]